MRSAQNPAENPSDDPCLVPLEEPLAITARTSSLRPSWGSWPTLMSWSASGYTSPPHQRRLATVKEKTFDRSPFSPALSLPYCQTAVRQAAFVNWATVKKVPPNSPPAIADSRRVISQNPTFICNNGKTQIRV